MRKKDISRVAVINKIENTIVVVNKAPDTLTEEDLKAEYPTSILEGKTSTEYFLVHLTIHMAYKFGRINYHRRLLDAAFA